MYALFLASFAVTTNVIKLLFFFSFLTGDVFVETIVLDISDIDICQQTLLKVPVRLRRSDLLFHVTL